MLDTFLIGKVCLFFSIFEAVVGQFLKFLYHTPPAETAGGMFNHCKISFLLVSEPVYHSKKHFPEIH